MCLLLCTILYRIYVLACAVSLAAARTSHRLRCATGLHRQNEKMPEAFGLLRLPRLGVEFDTHALSLLRPLTSGVLGEGPNGRWPPEMGKYFAYVPEKKNCTLAGPESTPCWNSVSDSIAIVNCICIHLKVSSKKPGDRTEITFRLPYQKNINRYL